MAIDYKAIGTRIQELRKEKGFNQATVAEILEVTTGYISQIETASSKLNLEMLVNIAEVLDKDPGFLLNGTCTTNSEYKLMEINSDMEQLSGKDRQIIYEIMKILKKHEKLDEDKTKNVFY